MTNLDIIFTTQRIVVAVLFLAVSYYWFTLKREGIEDLFRKPIIINLLLFLAFPFIIIAIPSFKENHRLLIEFVGILIVSLVLFGINFKEFRKTDKKRKKELKELFEEKKPKHPIALEFARKIVDPEIKKLRSEEKRIKNYERKIDRKIVRAQEEIKQKDNEIKKKTDEFNKMVESRKNKAENEIRKKDEKVEKRTEDFNKMIEKSRDEL